MKQFLLIFTILLVAMFAFACGGGESDKTDSEDMAQKPEMTATSGGYMATTVTNGGSITGTVTFAGAIPPKVKIEKTKDTAVCGKTTHYAQDLLVSADKGLANVVVSITNISEGKSMESMGEYVLDQNGCVFVPHVTMIPVGAELSILNSDGILHNIHTFSEKNNPINVAQPKFKKKITQSFSEAEIFPVKCDVHNWMNGYIAVAEHPYYAKTDDNGSFQLTDVPAGTYTVQYWHEKLGTQTMEVTVTGGASADASLEYAAMGS